MPLFVETTLAPAAAAVIEFHGSLYVQRLGIAQDEVEVFGLDLVEQYSPLALIDALRGTNYIGDPNLPRIN